MGLRFRKSINLGGGFKINLSKSGIGYSWGVPGYRITKTATGRTRKTYSIPGSGLSYVSENNTNTPKKVTNSSNPINSVSTGSTVTFGVGNIKDHQGGEYLDFLNAIKRFKRWNLVANILIATILLFATPIFIFTAILGIALKFYVHSKLAIPIEYEFDDVTKAAYEKRYHDWISLSSSQRLWQLLSSTSVLNKKQVAGAANLVKRQKIKIISATPNFLKTDEKYVTLCLKNEKLYFMPDKLLIVSGKNIGAIAYNDFSIDKKDYPFIEDESVPKDTEIIRYTWLKVNKDGSPDKRFKGNRQIPVCKYGLITLENDSGFNIKICCSNNALISD